MAKEKFYLLQFIGGEESETFVLRDVKTQQIIHLSKDVDDLSSFLREDVDNLKNAIENE